MIGDHERTAGVRRDRLGAVPFTRVLVSPAAVAEAVAAHSDGDDTIDPNGTQTIIDWWATGTTVDGTQTRTRSLDPEVIGS